jgi:hypothetical protein
VEKYRSIVIGHVEFIREIGADGTPGRARRALQNAIEKLRIAQTAVGAVPSRYRDVRRIVERVLEHMIVNLEGKIAKLRVQRSGGAKTAGLQMLQAAFSAAELLGDVGQAPTLTREGAYYNLTGALYTLATGRVRDPERACRKCIKQIIKGDVTGGTDAFEDWVGLNDDLDLYDILPPDHPRRRATAQK